VYAW
jgi:hypothetical protein